MSRGYFPRHFPRRSPSEGIRPELPWLGCSSAVPEGAEAALWEAQARRIFDELGLDADEQFWQMAEPVRIIKRNDGNSDN